MLLIGSTLLFMSRELRWWPASASFTPNLLPWAIEARGILTLSVIAGAVGYYACLRGAKRPITLLLLGSILPVIVSLLLLLTVAELRFGMFEKAGDESKVFAIGSETTYLRALFSEARDFGPGLQCLFLGFILTAAFLLLYMWGQTTLPLRIKPKFKPSMEGVPDEAHSRSMLFIWIMISLVPLCGVLDASIEYALTCLGFHVVGKNAVATQHLLRLIDAGSLFLLVAIAIGKAGRSNLPRMLRLGREQDLLAAIFLPAVLGSSWTLGM